MNHQEEDEISELGHEPEQTVLEDREGIEVFENEQMSWKWAWRMWVINYRSTKNGKQFCKRNQGNLHRLKI